ncbi:hypothetical protein [Burkholderia territorii]|uniref:hypothetical protein n=1 Tax=Burkholderia territorii TaxID=1503055 RepID=UPI00075281B6|nr:hypothetical protein [Burkholderia territorii]KWO55254.1 hypothetical protein WT98_08855 [Burkholderia territorii]
MWSIFGATPISMKNAIIIEIFYLGAIARRARALLTSRDDDALESCAANVDAFITEFFDTLSSESAFRDDDASFRRGVVSDTWVLRQVIPAYDLDSDPDFPAGQRFEYFAVLALSHAIEANSYLGRSAPADDVSLLPIWDAIPPQQVKAMLGELRWTTVAHHAVEAMEAVCWAEHLADQANVGGRAPETDFDSPNAPSSEMAIKRRISEIASRAAMKRHLRTRRAKREAYDQYMAHRLDYSTLDEMAAHISTSMHAVTTKTIRKWLTEFNHAGYSPPDQLDAQS